MTSRPITYLQTSGSGLGLAVSVVICAATWLLMQYIRKNILQNKEPLNVAPDLSVKPLTEGQIRLANTLKKELPDSVFFKSDAPFKESVESYWAMQARQVAPHCIIRPSNAAEVASAISIIKQEYDASEASLHPQSLKGDFPAYSFGVRSGGHNTAPGAANARNGVVLDLRLLNSVQLSEDATQVHVGPGARWGDVSRFLDPRGLAIAGGRNSSVGVGGLTLGGGLSYFSPRVGFVCNNVVSYEVVLADGRIVTADSTVNHDLWRALRGGSNNFGVVTCFSIRTFPCADVWAGFLFSLSWSWNSSKMIRAFHDFCTTEPDEYDEYAAGPLVCFVYIQAVRLSIIATNLVYTKPVQWPKCFEKFRDVGRVWSTVKLRSLTSATEELEGQSPAGFRQLHCTTTIRADHKTLVEAHSVYTQRIQSVSSVSGLIWSLIFQPIHPTMVDKGEGNEDVLGLRSRVTVTLVVIELSFVWKKAADDDLVNRTAKDIIGAIETYAAQRGVSDNFKYLNYCAAWQNPFEGYGATTKPFLEGVSRAYDPTGLFQRGCGGGFKLFPDTGRQ